MALMGHASVGVEKEDVGIDAKSKKAESYKKFKENKAAKQKAMFEDSIRLRDELVKLDILDKLTTPVKNFVLSLCKNPNEKKAPSGFGGPSVFSILFGDNPVVGQKITLEEAFAKTFKGKSTLDQWVKRWAEKGIIVECVVDQAKMLNTTYTIKALPEG